MVLDIGESRSGGALRAAAPKGTTIASSGRIDPQWPLSMPALELALSVLVEARMRPPSRIRAPANAPLEGGDPSRRTDAPVLPQIRGAADDEPGNDGSQQADQRRDRAEVLSHVDLQLAQAAFLVLE